MLDFDDVQKHVKLHAGLYVDAYETADKIVGVIKAVYLGCSVTVSDTFDEFLTAQDFKHSDQCKELIDYVYLHLSARMVEIYEEIKELVK